MSKIKPIKKKFKVKKEKNLKGGGKETVLISEDNQDEVMFIESGDYLYFVGVTEPRIKLGDKKALRLVEKKYQMK